MIADEKIARVMLPFFQLAFLPVGISKSRPSVAVSNDGIVNSIPPFTMVVPEPLIEEDLVHLNFFLISKSPAPVTVPPERMNSSLNSESLFTVSAPPETSNFLSLLMLFTM